MAAASAFASVYPQYRAPALAAGGAVALAQIPTCAHYPSDVAAGATLGAASNGALSLAWKAIKSVAAFGVL
jgi:membrane-associated phospholipid phosphatase